MNGIFQKSLLVATLMGICATSEAGELLMKKGTMWRYHSEKEAPAAEWKNSDFKHKGWKSGKGPLGYGDKIVKKVISYGDDSNNKYLTAYFRKQFKVSEAKLSKGYIFELMADDGAVIYINGKEVLRHNMKPGAVTHTTSAQDTINNSDETKYNKFVIKKDLFTVGKNVVAVEIHQVKDSSSDLIFDLSISTGDGVVVEDVEEEDEKPEKKEVKKKEVKKKVILDEKLDI